MRLNSLSYVGDVYTGNSDSNTRTMQDFEAYNVLVDLFL